jgi:hypothetical protein
MTPDQHERLMSARQEWSGLLVGALVVYGFAPRLLLLALCLGQRRHAASMYRINLDRPEFARLQKILVPAVQTIGVIDADDRNPWPSPTQMPAPPPRPVAAPAILSFELPGGNRTSWPPALHQVRWHDLGAVDTREDQRRVLGQLSSAAAEPSTLVIVCSLTSTPDRGVGTFFREVLATVSRPVTLVLTGGESLRRRTGPAQLECRVADWRSLANAAGIDSARIIEVDLDHLTQTSAAKLASLINHGDPSQPVMQRRIESALALIADQARQWFETSSPPGEAQVAELHRSIARLYRDEPASWRDLLRVPNTFAGNIREQLKVSGNRVVELLPDRLRRSSRWIAAGATAGALGCVAAASLISPVAISALPIWSALGAGVSAVASLRKSHDHEKDQLRHEQAEKQLAERDMAISDAVRAAALFALLLELQGRGEATITRVLEFTLQNEPEQREHEAFADAAGIQNWLNQIRHQLDLALARESRP